MYAMSLLNIMLMYILKTAKTVESLAILLTAAYIIAVIITCVVCVEMRMSSGVACEKGIQ